jgi:histidinol phosphatase-like enzyme
VAAYARTCDCRKPAPGMILRAARALQLDPAASILFGDRPSDIDAARRAGVGRQVLLATDGVERADEPAGNGDGSGAGVRPDYRSLSAAVDALLGA